LLNRHTGHRGALRVSADVGGTITDVAVFSQTTGEFSLGIDNDVRNEKLTSAKLRDDYGIDVKRTDR
jgi:N-methylhydantoinase A/oxoprolinase/acetone carboxylase beta subunit